MMCASVEEVLAVYIIVEIEDFLLHYHNRRSIFER